MSSSLAQLKPTVVSKLAAIPGFKGVGLGDGKIIVYVTNQDAANAVASLVVDFPVEIIISGEIVAS